MAVGQPCQPSKRKMMRDFVGAGPRACPDTPGPIVSIHAVRIGKF
jgi:hypothetical protein